MSEIVQHIGHEAARKLVQHFGGTTVMVPTGKRSHLPDVEQALGKEATDKLIWAFGGLGLYVPRRYKEILLHRNISICLEFEDELSSFGTQKAVDILARRHGCSDRNIYLILKGTDPRAVAAERRRRRMVGQQSADRAPDGSVPSKTM